MWAWFLTPFNAEDLETYEIETDIKKIIISVKSNDQGRFFKLIEVSKPLILEILIKLFFVSHSKRRIKKVAVKLYSLSKLLRLSSVTSQRLLRSTRPSLHHQQTMTARKGTTRKQLVHHHLGNV